MRIYNPKNSKLQTLGFDSPLPDQEKLSQPFYLKDAEYEALTVGLSYYAVGSTKLALTWLNRSMPNPLAALRIAEMYARSRSMRSSRTSLRFATAALKDARYLEISERQELIKVIEDLMKRRFSPAP